jgi:hypothetical protein
MQFINYRGQLNKSLFLLIAIIFPILPLLISCSDNQEPADKSTPTDSTESFTFFDLGRTTRLTESVRDDLTDRLGPDAIERRSILNLETIRSGFLKTHFPELEELNQELNFPPRERVEHNTVKLMYRYARKKNVPFELVELVFSDYSNTPLLFKINFKVDEANTIGTLREKYGKPEVINWGEENGKSMVWKKNGDFLIVSLIPDRFGNTEYQIVIYYIDNLKQLIAIEQKEREAKELQRAKSVKKAF